MTGAGIADTPVRATVIVPTHDRHATLDLAIASIQGQTVRNIEIVIAGDGVTPAVRSVAAKLAAQDSRIRFLDHEKAPGRGYENRHRALLASRGDCIFYCDDDDIWFPDHVEKLLEGLARAEVIDSAVLSVARSGRIHRAFVNHSHPSERAFLAQGGPRRMTFDTHLAHRRSLYLRLGSAWMQGVGGMLSAFARSGAEWCTYNGATALSLHGSARRLSAHDRRREEIAAWQSRVASGLPASAAASGASGVWYLDRALQRAPAQGGERLRNYLGRMGLAAHGIPEGGFAGAGDPVAPTMPADVAIDMETVLDLSRRTATSDAAVARVLLPLVEPLLGPTPRTAAVARALRRAMPLKRALRVVSQVRTERPHDAELQALLRAQLLVMRGKADRAMAILARGPQMFDRYAPDAALMLARLKFRDGQGADALETLRLADGQSGGRHDVRLALAEMLWQAGARDEAVRLCESVLEASAGNRAATRLLARIETVDG